MPNLRVISVLFLLSFIILSSGEDLLEDEGGGTKVKKFFDETSRHIRDYKGIFSKSMEKDMWAFVFIAAIVTFGICSAVYFFDMLVFYTRRLINWFSGR